MLAHLLEVYERIFQSPTYCSHASKSGTFELLALEQRLGIFEQTNIVSRDGLDQVTSRGQLPKGYSEVVCIVEGIEQVLVERVDVLEAGKAVKDH